MPLSLSDAEFAAVQAAAAPVHPMQRDAFLRALAAELERHPVVGPGGVAPLSSRPSGKRRPSRANSWPARSGAEGARTDLIGVCLSCRF
jgi:hypothetical protein